jgi:hypothetical protein
MVFGPCGFSFGSHRAPLLVRLIERRFSFGKRLGVHGRALRRLLPQRRERVLDLKRFRVVVIGERRAVAYPANKIRQARDRMRDHRQRGGGQRRILLLQSEET